MFDFPEVSNNPLLKGQPACKKRLFGDHGRYAIAPVHSRFEAVQWFVWDAEDMDEDGLPSVIRLADTQSEALEGLEHLL